ncbi:MAG: DEAD/DEAH box helicase [Dehalococcoidia bacterium]|nr:DEAD/DEAH box helicase [Dehalococcoidia bacterium]
MVTIAAPSFSDFKLSPGVQSAIAEMGIVSPTPIQSQVIPAMLAGRDVIGQARTGSGKTLAFAAPVVDRVDPRQREVQALVLVPTRELALQVGEVLDRLARSRSLRMTLLYGGRSLEPEKRALFSAQIVVGTPGRTLDHLRQGTLSLAGLKMFILDEGDEMLDKGFGPDVERILSGAPAGRQIALLSATVPDWVTRTAARYQKDPVLARVDMEIAAPPEIEHIIYTTDLDSKFDALRTLLNQQGPDPIMVFGRTKHGVKKLARKLEELGYHVAPLQGNMSQNARERVMTDFRAGHVRVLVATNVAARGLDIAGVEQVINYEMPDSAELFTHRVGRTGRMGRSGEAVTFVTPDEAPKWRQIQRELGRTFTVKPWPRNADLGQSPEPRPIAAEPARHQPAPRRQPTMAPRQSDRASIPYRVPGAGSALPASWGLRAESPRHGRWANSRDDRRFGAGDDRRPDGRPAAPPQRD